MSKENGNIGTLGYICFTFLLILAIAGVAIIGVFAWTKATNFDITQSTNFISSTDVSTEPTEEPEEVAPEEPERTLTINYYSNENSNGTVLQELMFTAYADFNFTEKIYLGMQVTYDYELIVNTAKVKTDEELLAYYNSWYDTSFNYYVSHDGVSYKEITPISRQNILYLSIDGEPYALKMDKYNSESNYALFGLILTSYKAWVATYSSLFANLMDTVESCSYGFGDYEIAPNLSKYFSLYKFNTQTNKLENTDVLSDYVSTFVTTRVHYDKNGAVASNQSLFGIINYDPSYDHTGITDVNYWKYYTIHTIDLSKCSLRYSELYQGNLLTLNSALISKLQSDDYVKFRIKIDCSDSSIVGLDFYAFAGVVIDSVELINNGENKDFYICDYALPNLSNDKINATNLNLIISDNAFMEVADEN